MPAHCRHQHSARILSHYSDHHRKPRCYALPISRLPAGRTDHSCQNPCHRFRQSAVDEPRNHTCPNDSSVLPKPHLSWRMHLHRTQSHVRNHSERHRHESTPSQEGDYPFSPLPVSTHSDTDSLHSFQDYHPDKIPSNKRSLSSVRPEGRPDQTYHISSHPATTVQAVAVSIAIRLPEELHKECLYRQQLLLRLPCPQSDLLPQ